MTNYARNHFQKHSAKAAAETAAEFGTMQNMTAYELQLMQLNNDRQRLKQIQSTAGKVVLKTTLLPNYLPYVDGILEADQSVQDEIYMTMLVWSIDIGEYTKALQMADFALRHNMLMPDSFKRSTATYVTESIAEAFLSTLKTSADVDISVLLELDQVLSNEDQTIDPKLLDMPDQVKAKLLVALGKSRLKAIHTEIEKNSGEIDEETPEWVFHDAQTAKVNFDKALFLDQKCGCRADLKAVDKLIEKLRPYFPVEPVAGESSPT